MNLPRKNKLLYLNLLYVLCILWVGAGDKGYGGNCLTYLEKSYRHKKEPLTIPIPLKSRPKNRKAFDIQIEKDRQKKLYKREAEWQIRDHLELQEKEKKENAEIPWQKKMHMEMDALEKSLRNKDAPIRHQSTSKKKTLNSVVTRQN